MKNPAASPVREWMFRIFSSAPRVASLLAIAGTALFFYARAAFRFIREESSSPRTDFSLRLYFYLGLLLTSFLAAILLDSLLNRKAWLLHITKKHEPAPGDTPDFTNYTRHPIQFYFYFLLTFIGAWFFYDKINNYFHSYYGSIGKYMTLLRSPNEEDRLAAIERLATTRHPRMVGLMVRRIETGTDRERIIATWAAGNAEIRDPAIVQAITRNLESPQEALRHASFLALARIVERPTVEFVRRLEDELRRFLAQSQPPAPHLLFAAAFLRTPEFLPVFLDAFALEDPATSVIATYAIVWMTGTTAEQNRRILERLDRSLAGSDRLRCMNTVALLFKAPELSVETLMALRREFEAKSSDFRCRPEVFSLHPFDPRRDTINITRINIQGFRYLANDPEPYRERILRVLARVRDDTMIPWLERMSKNEQLPEYIRDLCRQTAQARPAHAPSTGW